MSKRAPTRDKDRPRSIVLHPNTAEEKEAAARYLSRRLPDADVIAQALGLVEA